MDPESPDIRLRSEQHCGTVGGFPYINLGDVMRLTASTTPQSGRHDRTSVASTCSRGSPSAKATETTTLH